MRRAMGQVGGERLLRKAAKGVLRWGAFCVRSCHGPPECPVRKVRKLEEHLGIYLGEGFAFDAMTAKAGKSSIIGCWSSTV